MKKPINNKTKMTATIAFVLLLTISAMLVALPIVTAANTKATYAYIGAVPNPGYVDQPVLLHVGITDYTQVAEDGFHGLSVFITRPDGETETIDDISTDSTGGTGRVYLPTMVGTYYLQTHFPAQWYNYSYSPFPGWVFSDQTWYEASDSDVLELVVTDEPPEYYSPTPIPDEYWTRPIDAQHRGWYTIGGSWLTTPPNLVADYNEDAPETAHVLWSRPLTTGGLVGGALGEQGYECGDAYEGMFTDSVIISGVLYYNKFKSGYPVQEVVAVDLHTGEELWCKTLGDNERVSFGQTFYWSSYNYHGSFDYIYTTVTIGSWWAGTTNWNAYDAKTGDYVFSYEDVPSGTIVYGPRGEIYRYSVNTMAGTMTLWNSSRAVSDSGSWMGGTSGAGYRTFNASLGIEWTKPIAPGLAGSAQAVLDDRIVGSSLVGWFGGAGDDSPISLWAISTEPGHEGEEIFNTSWQPPTGNITYLWSAASLEAGVFVISAKETRIHYGFDIDTGDLLWSTDPQPYMDMWWGETYINEGVNIAYGKLFSAGYAGIVFCYDTADGNLLWNYTANDQYAEILWSNNWPLRTLFFADGKIYLTHTEHSPIDPKARGAPMFAVDVETGELVFRIDGAFRGTVWGGNAVIGDSIIATMNTYDQQIYAIGKGASATTVETPLVSVAEGSGITIQGTVMDVSPGTAYPEQTLRFPNGVPAVADEDMSEWMLYVYMQFERPENLTGVPVRLEAITPAGDRIWFGTATSDAYGNYGYKFTPDTEGLYMIIASFDGSDSYYGSASTTYLTVDPAPEEVDLAPLEGSVSNVQGSVSDLEGSVTDLEGSVSDLEGSVSDDLSGLEGSVSDLEGSVTDLEGSVSDLSGLEGSVSDVEDSVGGLESSMSNLTTYIIAILVIVIIALVIAVYSMLKPRK